MVAGRVPLLPRLNNKGPGMSDFFDNWTVQVRKGLLEMCILTALKHREYYGYDLVKSLVGTPGLGVTEGTIYPLLSRLRRHGLITSRLEESNEGPARKYYLLTQAGQEVIGSMDQHLKTLIKGIKTLQKEET
jgi:PadR family transcriptional regulator, regulatory protein PadR